MRFIHADQTEEDAEEEDEMMSKIRRQIDYMQFFQGFRGKIGTPGGDTMRPTGDNVMVSLQGFEP